MTMKADRRPDPHKVFIGSLQPSVGKPMLLKLCEELMLEPVDIKCPMVRPGKLAIAFATFSTQQEAMHAIDFLNGIADWELSPTQIVAHMGGSIMGCLQQLLQQKYLGWV